LKSLHGCKIAQAQVNSIGSRKNTHIQRTVAKHNKTASMGVPSKPRALMGGEINFTSASLGGLKLKKAELTRL
jgi:hypothetical protein